MAWYPSRYVILVPADPDKSWRGIVYGGQRREFYHLWSVITREIRRRDKQRCRVKDCCGEPSGLSVHHIIPRSVGGGSFAENLILLCREHHAAIENEWQKFSTPQLIENYREEISTEPATCLPCLREGLFDIAKGQDPLLQRLSLASLGQTSSPDEK